MSFREPGPRHRGPGSFFAQRSGIRTVALIALITTALVSCSTDDPPTAPQPQAISDVGRSPFADCLEDMPLARLINESSEVEPTAAVDPRSPANIAIAWQQDRWVNGASRGIVVAATSDGGVTWDTTSDTNLSPCSGGGSGSLPRVTDPWLSFGPEGTLYLSALRVDLDRNAPVGANPEEVVVTRSGDGGRTWSEPAVVVHDDDALVYNDKPSLTADPLDEDLVYVVWHRLKGPTDAVVGETMLARSRDGGITWERPRTILGPLPDAQSFGNEIVPVAERGGATLFNAFSLLSWEKDEEDKRAEVAVMRSRDSGRSWSKPRTIAQFHAVPVRDPLAHVEIKSGHLLPRIAADSRSDALYAVWSEGDFGRGRYNDVAFSMSTDKGRSWSDAIRINQTPAADEDARQTFMPEITVDDEGGVAVSYFDFRNHDPRMDPGDILATDLFVVRCGQPSDTEPDSCAGDWNETRVTRRSFDMGSAPESGGPFLGDYLGLAAAADKIVIAFPLAGSHDDPSSIYVDVLHPDDQGTP